MVKSQKKSNHPWLMAAMFCQGTLEEKDNVLSAIRIIDRFILQPPPEWDRKTHIQIMTHALLGFKSGDVKGERKIKLFAVSPKGKRKKINEFPVVFLGGDNGVNVRVNIAFGVRTPGTHWLEVYVENWLATRMPLTVVLDTPPSPSEESKQPKDDLLLEEKKESPE